MKTQLYQFREQHYKPIGTRAELSEGKQSEE